MSSWNSPKSLQKSSASVVTKCLVTKIIVTSKRSQRLHSNGFISSQKFASSLKKQLFEIEEWWTSIPGFYGKLGHALQMSLDELTEHDPNVIWEPMDHVISLLLKVFLLDFLFIDRDYSNNFGLCSIPSAYEDLTLSILTGHTFRVKKLFLYGAMYPSIVETIISNSVKLKHLAISQINLTDNIMDCIARCRELEILHLMHNYIWMVVSTSALCKGFFTGASETLVSNKYHNNEDLSLSFVKLKEIDIGTCTNNFVLPFYKMLLYFYDISSIHLQWKTCVFEEDSKHITEKIILPLILKGKTLRLNILHLNAYFLSSLSNQTINFLSNFMPDVNHLFVDCEINYKIRDKIAGQKFKTVASKFKSISHLSLNVSSDNSHTSNIIIPFLKDCGTNLKSLTLTSEYQGQAIEYDTLELILRFCPNISILKFLFLTRFSIKYENQLEMSNFHLKSTKLTELWFHEVSPWDIKQGQSSELYTDNWKLLLNYILQASPHLKILSVTACENMSNFLLKLQANVACLHLHIKDGCEWNVDENILINMIKRFPNLEFLYLEELEGETFWKIKTYFRLSDLGIFWGNLGSWPKT